MKTIQCLFMGTFFLVLVFVEFSYAISNSEEDSTNIANVKNNRQGSSVMVIKVWGADEGQPGISYDNQEGNAGTLPLQCADATDPDVATVGNGIIKFLVVAYYSPQSNSYLAEYFEWKGSSLISLGTPVVLMTKVNNHVSLKVEGNYSGEFSIEFDSLTSVNNPENNINGSIDPVTGLPKIILAPRMNYLINHNYE